MSNTEALKIFLESPYLIWIMYVIVLLATLILILNFLLNFLYLVNKKGYGERIRASVLNDVLKMINKEKEWKDEDDKPTERELKLLKVLEFKIKYKLGEVSG
jgi:hypothetical protein